jgi:hypothetical protein
VPEKAQFMISVEPELRDRLDALRIVAGTSRADVGRTIWEKYTHLLERSHRERLERLEKVARERGYPHWQGLVRDIIAESASKNSTNRGQRLPSLEELEDPEMPRFRRERREVGSASGVIPAAFVSPGAGQA